MGEGGEERRDKRAGEQRYPRHAMGFANVDAWRSCRLQLKEARATKSGNLPFQG